MTTTADTGTTEETGFTSPATLWYNFAVYRRIIREVDHSVITTMAEAKHIKTIVTPSLSESMKHAGCSDCQTSCQSACKTSCTVGNIVCPK